MILNQSDYSNVQFDDRYSEDYNEKKVCYSEHYNGGAITALTPENVVTPHLMKKR